jgi:hypothetical protein
MCETRPGLGLELVAGQVLRAEGEGLVQVAFEVGGALAGNPVEQVEREVVETTIAKMVERSADVVGPRVPLQYAQETGVERLRAYRHAVDAVS